ncbi:hypothetical protein RAB80_011307 [Fusarium oxysporum f. sp. vasinfectum]|nr:hypothetical protein RAB80_011307 [Fusarium oxysporum f. sp. vasinfectum]
MSTQHNYLDDDDDFSEFYNNPLYKRVSDLTPHERNLLPKPSPRKDSIRKYSFKKPRQIPDKEYASEPEEADSALHDSPANRDFQQNVARVLGPEHIGKYENCADMANKAKEELEDKPEGSHHLGRPWNKEEFDKAARLTQ